MFCGLLSAGGVRFEPWNDCNAAECGTFWAEVAGADGDASSRALDGIDE